MFRYGSYTFRIATTADLLAEVQALRYRVYVEECRFERPEDHPAQREADAYDDVSIHLVAQDADSRVIGTSRLVLNSAAGLPVFHALRSDAPVNIRSLRLAEVSRLAVDPGFRVRRPQPVTDGRGSVVFLGRERPSQSQRDQSVVTRGLIALLLETSLRLRLTHWIMIGERKLWLMLRRLGIDFHPVGEAVEYHGLRTPYLADLSLVGGGILDGHAGLRRQFAAPEAAEAPRLVPAGGEDRA